MKATLSGRLPAGDGDGLSTLGEALVNSPERIHVAVMLVDCVKLVRRVDSGEQYATMRVRRVEVIGDADDRRRLQMMLTREFERRTGQAVLPFELEEDIRLAFEEMDLHDDGDPQ